MAGLPPPPINDKPGSFTWLQWYQQLQRYISQSGSVPWSVVDKAGSNISDIQNRNHNNLQNIQGGTSGEFYHLTSAQYAAIGIGNHNNLNAIQGGNSSNRWHLSMVITASATLDFPSIAAGGSQNLTITASGAVVNDGVILGLPSSWTAGIIYQAFVSAANTVTIRATNITGSAIDPVSASFFVMVVR